MLQDDDETGDFWRKARFEQLLREDFCAFIAKCFATVNPSQAYLPNWHIELLAEALLAAGRGEVTRLVVNVPPRSLKSLCVSVAWPAWMLGHDPAKRILVASYAQSLANKHALDCRRIMQSAWYKAAFPRTQIAADQNEKHKFLTTQEGMRLATSLYGVATGEGGDVLIADDPMNPQGARSPVMRQAAKDWLDHTFMTRLNDKRRGCVVLVMQRLHADDVAAYALAKGGWKKLVLPATAMRDEQWEFGGKVFRRKAGELLHPAREDEALLRRAESELGAYAFAAQYQQAPLAREGAMVKLEWFERFA